ncbi:PREDICTED: uncharacterized protein LOC109228000 [Nicotiana attenuata]|uniref:uncharacterized protein LOC109228000 n=1 Tax=Nicotiana attenuata TaxID=49451 RepID=UPI0009055B87|nr:PREDICTED: uncharacterized protein LOC109228000 [Nicotiana attenuata]
MKKDALWIKWIHAMYIKKEDFTEMQTPRQASWLVKKIFDIRDWYKEIETVANIDKFCVKGKFSIHKILTTVDRLAKWGIQVDQDCVLCKRRQTENMEHIYFECQYTKYIWSKLVWMGENHQIGTWLEEVTWMSKRARSGRAQNNMLVFLFAAVMYQVWTERNMRRFQGKEKEAERKVRDIVLQVHIKGQQNAKWKKRLEQLNSFP